MSQRSVVFLALLSVICLLPGQVWSSIIPTSAGLGLGYSNELGPSGNNWTPVPMVVATWDLSEHASIRSSVSYLQERRYAIRRIGLATSGYPSTSFTDSRETRRDHFVPLAAGVRFSAGSASARSGGPFVDLSPAAYIAQINTSAGSPSTRLLAGYQIGLGFRFSAFDGSHAELGIAYYRSEAASPERRDSLEISNGHEGVNAADLYVTISLGR